ncbi:hypothetical protein [Bradyrhizobium sp. LTSPM299]|uniref:hypothetical protein n=1 Tax=Bradyrhizobium sp. LTSPM299 TaxID=1619233 RepID=UPI0007C69F0F|nr:hypothetical protein [Bradyrhizobium sp. LTSPM299]
MEPFGSDPPAAREANALDTTGSLFDPVALLHALDQRVPGYYADVDRGLLVYPACKRSVGDVQADVRSIWEHTRIEAARYIMAVPQRDFALLTHPERQAEMFDVFLRQKLHEDTVVEFTEVPTADLTIAIVAGLNWLNQCAYSAGVDPSKCTGTLRNFRKVAVVARQWWSLEGSGDRCHKMLTEGGRPPLMLYLVWSEYTRLSKEVAVAATYGSSLERAAEAARDRFVKELPERPDEMRAALAASAETFARLHLAVEPAELPL